MHGFLNHGPQVELAPWQRPEPGWRLERVAGRLLVPPSSMQTRGHDDDDGADLPRPAPMFEAQIQQLRRAQQAARERAQQPPVRQKQHQQQRHEVADGEKEQGEKKEEENQHPRLVQTAAGASVTLLAPPPAPSLHLTFIKPSYTAIFPEHTPPTLILEPNERRHPEYGTLLQGFPVLLAAVEHAQASIGSRGGSASTAVMARPRLLDCVVQRRLGDDLRVRFQIIGNACIKNVGKSQSCMVSKLPIIWKQTVGDGDLGEDGDAEILRNNGGGKHCMMISMIGSRLVEEWSASRVADAIDEDLASRRARRGGALRVRFAPYRLSSAYGGVHDQARSGADNPTKPPPSGDRAGGRDGSGGGGDACISGAAHLLLLRAAMKENIARMELVQMRRRLSSSSSVSRGRRRRWGGNSDSDDDRDDDDSEEEDGEEYYRAYAASVAAAAPLAGGKEWGNRRWESVGCDAEAERRGGLAAGYKERFGDHRPAADKNVDWDDYAGN